jgi:hypothetical protein
MVASALREVAACWVPYFRLFMEARATVDMNREATSAQTTMRAMRRLNTAFHSFPD